MNTVDKRVIAAIVFLNVIYIVAEKRLLRAEKLEGQIQIFVYSIACMNVYVNMIWFRYGRLWFVVQMFINQTIVYRSVTALPLKVEIHLLMVVIPTLLSTIPYPFLKMLYDRLI